MPLGEEWIAIAVAQFFFHATQEPLIAPTCTGIFQNMTIELQAVIARIRELVCIEETQKMRKLAGIAAMRGGREEKDALSTNRKTFGELIASRLCHFLTLRACSAFVRFINDHQVPRNLLQTLGDALLLGEVERGNALAIAIPDIASQLIADHVGVNYLKRLIEFAIQLLLPLEGQWGGCQDEHIGDDTP